MEHQHEHEHSHTPVEVDAPVREVSERQGTPGWLLPASIMAAAVLISGSLVYMVQGGKGITPIPTGTATSTQQTAVTATAPTAQERDTILGKADAPVSIVAYEDFQCPFCAQYFTDTESQIRTAYVEPGKVKLVYRHLAFLGPESIAAASASECAKDQSKFWEYHDALFNAEIADGQEGNGNLKRSLFIQLAKDTKLDVNAFTSCIDSKKYDSYVLAQTKEAGTKYGVNSTPTIFVNDQKIEGAYPFSEFKTIIDGMLAK